MKINLVILYSFMFFTISAQIVEIEIDKSAYERAEKSLIVFSDSEGTIVKNIILRKENLEESFSFVYDIESENQKINLTLYNEYQAPNSDGHYFIARSFCGIEDFLEIENELTRTERMAQGNREIILTITGKQNIYSTEIYPQSSLLKPYFKLKEKEGNTIIKFDHPINEDLTAFFYSEENPKALTIAKTDLEKDYIVNWNSLRTDLEKVTIELPKYDDWNIEVVGMASDKTENHIYYSTKNKFERLNRIDFFILKDDNTDEIYSSFKRNNIDYENRREIIKIKGYNLKSSYSKFDNLNYNIDFLDEKGVRLLAENTEDKLAVNYKTKSYEVNKPSFIGNDPFLRSIVPYKFSRWYVKSEISGELDFIFPDLYEFHQDFPTTIELENIQPEVIGISREIGSDKIIATDKL